jgi:hypothetical protein
MSPCVPTVVGAMPDESMIANEWALAGGVEGRTMIGLPPPGPPGGSMIIFDSPIGRWSERLKSTNSDSVSVAQ